MDQIETIVKLSIFKYFNIFEKQNNILFHDESKGIPDLVFGTVYFLKYLFQLQCEKEASYTNTIYEYKILAKMIIVKSSSTYYYQRKVWSEEGLVHG